MNIYEAMQKRISVRQFLDKPVGKGLLRRALENAIRAPSWKNVQPYTVHVVSGQKRQELQKRFLRGIEARQRETPDEPYQPSWPTYMKKRMLTLGKALYEHLEIPRGDKAAREQQMLRNFTFFDAPTVLFIFTPRNMGFWPEFDIGIFFGYVMLALLEEGLASCPQASLAAYPDMVREVLGIDDNQKLLVGMSVGYAEETARVNTFRSEREKIEELVKFYE